MAFHCNVDLVGFLENTDTGLSPFFDLESFVKAERNRNNNLFQDTSSQQFAELKKVFAIWRNEESMYYLISGPWMRQWIRYIFVRIASSYLFVGATRPSSDYQQ